MYSQGRIHDLKLGVAQMDFKIVGGGGGGVNKFQIYNYHSIYIYISIMIYLKDD